MSSISICLFYPIVSAQGLEPFLWENVLVEKKCTMVWDDLNYSCDFDCKSHSVGSNSSQPHGLYSYS